MSDLTVVAKAFLGPGLICDIDINFMAHFLNYSLRVYYEPMKGSEQDRVASLPTRRESTGCYRERSPHRARKIEVRQLDTIIHKKRINYKYFIFGRN